MGHPVLSNRFDEAEHRYYIGDRAVPSVTQVLEVLEELDGVPRQQLEMAAYRGRLVHEACALLVRGALDRRSVHPTLKGYIAAAESFLKTASLVPLLVEHRLYDESLGVAGTLDLLAMFKGNKCIFDWKSAESMPRTAGPQTAAYDRLYRGRPSRMPRYGVHLLPDGSFKLHQYRSPSDWSMFVSALNCWKWKNRLWK